MVKKARDEIGADITRFDQGNFLHFLVSGYYGDVMGSTAWNDRDGADLSDRYSTRSLGDGLSADGTYRVELITNIIAGIGTGDSSLYGTHGIDYIEGGRGNDTIHGGAGDDRISGGEGNDEIHGGSGNDTIKGGLGNDLIFGGHGNDTIVGGMGNDTLYGGTGDDIIYGGTQPSETGSPISDGNNFIDGGSGNDTIYGGTGHDVIYGGSGDDIIFGGTNPGNSVFNNSSYYDTYPDGNDYIDGGDGDDTIYAGAGDDIVYGGRGNDVIFVNSGNDLIFGGAGDDVLYGGKGSDTYVWAKGDGNDRIIETPGIGEVNALRFSDVSADDVAIELHDHSFVLTIKSTGETITVVADRESFLKGEHINKIEWGDESIWEWDDIVHALKQDTDDDGDGEPGGDGTIYGSDGNDVISGGAENDTLDGGRGDDVYVFGKGDGHDVMVSLNAEECRNDILRLRDLNADDVELLAHFDSARSDLVVRIKETGETFTIAGGLYGLEGDLLTGGSYGNTGQFGHKGFSFAGIEFADGSRWSWEQIKQQPIGITQDSQKTPCLVHGDWNFANEQGYNIIDIHGRTVHFYHDPNGGQSGVLIGSDEKYALVSASSRSEAEFLKTGAGHAVLTYIKDREQSDDILVGSAANEYMEGGAGNDTYVYGRGGGHDIVNAFDPDANSRDVVRLYNLMPDDIEFLVKDNGSVFTSGAGYQINAWDLIIRVKNTGETLTIQNGSW